MILALAVLIGVVAGVLRAAIGRRQFVLPELKAEWLVLVAVVPQLLVFFVPQIERNVDQQTVSVILTTSLGLLFVFVWLNRRQVMLLVLGVGLLLNFFVIVLNGGLMPISPETILRLNPNSSVADWPYGERVPGTKDVLLPVEETRLAVLSDRFTLPSWLPLLVAYSIGDVFIAVGAFGFFWTAGGIARTGAPQ